MELALSVSLRSTSPGCGSWHRFLYLFVEVYGILILHAVETLLRSRAKPE